MVLGKVLRMLVVPISWVEMLDAVLRMLAIPISWVNMLDTVLRMLVTQSSLDIVADFHPHYLV